jgi:hypothetical protein
MPASCVEAGITRLCDGHPVSLIVAALTVCPWPVRATTERPAPREVRRTATSGAQGCPTRSRPIGRPRSRSGSTTSAPWWTSSARIGRGTSPPPRVCPLRSSSPPPSPSGVVRGRRPIPGDDDYPFGLATVASPAPWNGWPRSGATTTMRASASAPRLLGDLRALPVRLLHQAHRVGLELGREPSTRPTTTRS